MQLHHQPAEMQSISQQASTTSFLTYVVRRLVVKCIAWLAEFWQQSLNVEAAFRSAICLRWLTTGWTSYLVAHFGWNNVQLNDWMAHQ
jgi:hypothetical protein